MIISILTVLLVISLHLFPRRIREKVIYRLKRVFARIRGLARGVSAILAYTKRNTELIKEFIISSYNSTGH